MRPQLWSIVLLIFCVGIEPASAQNAEINSADTLHLKWHVFAPQEFEHRGDVLPVDVERIVLERHTFIEDTLLVFVKKGSMYNGDQVYREISDKRDSTTIYIEIYASSPESSAPRVHYVRTKKKYERIEDGRSRCFLTSWGGYILDSEGTSKIYADKATTTIPFMVGGCYGSGDDYKVHQRIWPSRAIIKADSITIKGTDFGWDCQVGVTLQVEGDEVNLVSEADWVRCPGDD